MLQKPLLANRAFLVRIICVIFALFIFHLPFSYAAQSPLETAQSDYNFQYTKFRDAQEKYVSARSSYLSFQTAAAKNEAFLRTKDYLAQADNLFLSYIDLVKENGNSINWPGDTISKDNLTINLTQESTFLAQNKTSLEGAKTLEDLVQSAKDLKTHFEGITTPKINF